MCTIIYYHRNISHYLEMQEFAGPAKIIFGNNFPFAKLATIATKNLRKYSDFSGEEFELVDNKNCTDLFPHLINN